MQFHIGWAAQTIWTQWQKASYWFNMYVSPWWMQPWSFRSFPNTQALSHFLNNLLALFILWLCPPFCYETWTCIWLLLCLFWDQAPS
jgi:hypothetical protein